MHITHLSLTNFRNFARLDVDVPEGVILLVGGNAQGKTSLLEAVYFLATFTSFHADRDHQLINFISSNEPIAVARIVADFCRAGTARRLEVRIIQEQEGFNGARRVRKEILEGGVKRKVGEAIGHFNAVLFLPQMLRIVEGPPEERRRYIDLAMAQVFPAYGQTLSDYRRTLGQRNALLKLLNEGNGDPSQLDYWDEQLSYFGSKIISARIHAIRELEKLASRFHQRLTRGSEVLRIDYRPAYEPLPRPAAQYSLRLDDPIDRTGLELEQIRDGFALRLLEIRDEEIARGMTTIGPHRDELRFLSNGIDLGTYGSRGQVRTTLLTLKLSELSWMKEQVGEWPVLLLDEILAELDYERRADLLDKLLDCRQALLTTTDLNLFTPNFVEAATRWGIKGGRLQADMSNG